MCVCETIGAPSMFIVIREAAVLASMLPHFDLRIEKKKRKEIFFSDQCRGGHTRVRE